MNSFQTYQPTKPMEIEYKNIILNVNKSRSPKYLMVSLPMYMYRVETNEFEQKIFNEYPMGGEISFHVDPCRKAYCQVCDYEPCPVRQRPFQERIPFSTEELTSPFEPEEFQAEFQV